MAMQLLALKRQSSNAREATAELIKLGPAQATGWAV